MSGGDVPVRPNYLGSARVDDVARMLTELTSELWILKDRNMVLEKLLTEAGVVKPGSIDSHQPDDELSAALTEERHALTARVFGAVLPADDRTAAALARQAAQ